MTLKPVDPPVWTLLLGFVLVVYVTFLWMVHF